MLPRYLCDVGEADDEGDEADDEDEDLLPLPQQQRILVHQSCDEAFHCAELTCHNDLASRELSSLKEVQESLDWARSDRRYRSEVIFTEQEESVCCCYLAVQAEHHEHGEEEDGPQRRHGQLGHGLWIR